MVLIIKVHCIKIINLIERFIMKIASQLQTAILKRDIEKVKDILKNNRVEDVKEALVEKDNFGSSVISYIIRVGDKDVLNAFIENYIPSKDYKVNVNGSSAELEIALRLTELDMYDVTKCLETVYEAQSVNKLLGQTNEMEV